MSDPINTLLKAFKNYLSKHGNRIISILDILNQDYVKTSIDSLFHYHDPATGYDKLMDAIEEILHSEEYRERLRDVGIEIVIEGEYCYIKSSYFAIKKLMKEIRGKVK